MSRPPKDGRPAPPGQAFSGWRPCCSGRAVASAEAWIDKLAEAGSAAEGSMCELATKPLGEEVKNNKTLGLR